MNSLLAKKPATVVRSYTEQVRDHLAATQRLQDQYFAALKRAEAQYFDGIKKIAEAMAQATEPTQESVPGEPVAPIATENVAPTQ